jgi:class 3 adenylate cyclase
MMSQPRTAAFLVTDIAASTVLWESEPTSMLVDHVAHDRILREAIDVNLGWVTCEAGDSFVASFPSASPALRAAVQAQHELQAQAWEVGRGIRVRMGLHAGPVFRVDGKLLGAPISVATRLCGAGDGDQILTTGSFATALECVPTGIDLIEVGEYLLRSASQSERIFRVDGVGLRSNSLSLRSSEAWEVPVEDPDFEIQLTTVKCEKERSDVQQSTIH